MRMLRLGFVGLLLITPALAQPPRGGEQFIIKSSGGGQGGPGGGGGRGGMMMMGGDPSQAFDLFSKGKDVIRRDDMDPMFQRMFDRMAERMNITNGQITRDQFKQSMEQMQQRMRDGGFGGPGGGGGGRGGDSRTEDRFKNYDKNGDGLLSSDEMSDRLKGERDKWDANKDGYIDLSEFKEYMKSTFGDRSNDRSSDKSPSPTPATPGTEAPSFLPQSEPDPDVKRPLVFRYGHLPKELPSWFTELDIDQDGQVGLYEWVKGGRAITEFKEMDANDDVFLTAEEVMRFLHIGKSGSLAVASNAEQRGPAYGFSRDRSSGNNNNGRGNRMGSGGPGNWTGGGGAPSWMGGGNNNNGDRTSFGSRGNNNGGGNERGMGPRGFGGPGGGGGDRSGFGPRGGGNNGDNGNNGNNNGGRDRGRGKGGEGKGANGERTKGGDRNKGGERNNYGGGSRGE